jgi:hypothetical protein
MITRTRWAPRIFVVLYCAAATLVIPRFSADAHVASGTTADCTLILDGEVEVDDADRFSKLIDTGNPPIADADDPRHAATFCLNSKGGSYSEALKIINLFPTNLKTLVRAENECYSACALICLAGKQYQGLGHFVPHRWLNIRGRLGFHAPYVPVDAPGERAYAAGVRAIAALLSRSVRPEGMVFYPPDLLAQALETGPTELFQIEWVHQAIHWNIRLDGLSIPPTAATGCVISRACINYVFEKEDPTNYAHMQDVMRDPDFHDTLDDLISLRSGVSSYEAPRKPTVWFKQPIIFRNQEYSTTFEVKFKRQDYAVYKYTCTEDLFQTSSGLMLNMLHTAASGKELPSRRSLRYLEHWFGETGGVTTAYFLNPDVKIRDLQNEQGLKRALACVVER